MKFQLKAGYSPAGDQTQAIETQVIFVVIPPLNPPLGWIYIGTSGILEDLALLKIKKVCYLL